MNNNKILAIDFGDRNTGLAITDGGGSVVFGKGVIKGKRSLLEIFETIMKIVREEAIKTVVFGIPESVEGHSSQADRMEKIGKRLEEYLHRELKGVEVIFYDESFSSFEARNMVKSTKFAGYGDKYSEHELAAMIILQKYIAGKEKG